MVQLLRRARAAGVTTFDVAESPIPRQAERLLAEAFPKLDPDLTVIVGRRLEDLVRREEGTRPTPAAPEGVSERLRQSLEDSNRRLGPNPIGVIDWTDRDLPKDLSWKGVTHGLAGVRPPWVGRRVAAGSAPNSVLTADSPDPILLSGTLSLLDTDLADSLESRGISGSETLLARDALAGGRLDGSRWGGSSAARGPEGGPVRLRDLQTEFGPVLRLAYLTESRERTMAQAAIRFAAYWPWVGSVVVPLPTADRLEEVLGSFATPPLTEEELRRARHFRGASDAVDR